MHKKGMNLQTIEDNQDEKEDISGEQAFKKYFDNTDLYQLLVFDSDSDNCHTLKMIKSHVGFPYE
jgi:hypothetical protein